MFDSLMKVVLSPVDIAVSVAADVVTLGGTLNDKDSAYTMDAAGRLVDNVENVVKPNENITEQARESNGG